MESLRVARGTALIVITQLPIERKTMKISEFT
jgi:hypothetical protein